MVLVRTSLRKTFFFLLVAAVFLPSLAFSQVNRVEDTVFLRARVGLSFYLGDNQYSPFNFNGEVPYSLGAELGYRFNPRYSLGLGFTFADYPGVTEFVNELDLSEHATTRTSIQLFARYLLSEGKIAPYLQAGFHATFGKTAVYETGTCLTTGDCPESRETSIGPLLGIGLDFFINENTSFFVEFGSNLTFADDIADGYDGNGFGRFDFLGAISIGAKINLTRFTPVKVERLLCPTNQIETDTPITFSGIINENATEPVVATWNLGDGATAPGLTATHSFASAGSYDVVFAATNGNGRSSSSKLCIVSVREK